MRFVTRSLPSNTIFNTTLTLALAIGLTLLPRGALTAQDTVAFKTFIQQQAAELRRGDHPPARLQEWEERRAKLRNDLVEAWGGFPNIPCELAPQKLGEIQKEGYRIEKLIFQTRPGVWMTANAYVPDQPGKVPAILHVHGHWAGAKQDPVVQSRCIGCARLGFFVLCVDAFGAGERGIDTRLGEYHGEMTAATLYPVGLPLSGLQVYENLRSVDYLLQRPEVDGSKIGITGASGGGNQTMYAGAFDERIRCVVPTCSVGNYQAYLGAACCLCEVVPGALTFTEEGDVLGLAANRGVMVTSATRDAFQFSVGEARKSFARVEAIAALYPDARVKHTIVDSPHAYNQPMREALYGWMTLHLKGTGDGSPIAEAPMETIEPELLRCFPGETRPEDFVTLPRFAKLEAERLAALRPATETPDAWREQRRLRHLALIQRLGGFPASTRPCVRSENSADNSSQRVTFESEPGITLTARRDLPERPGRMALVIDLDGGAEAAFASPTAQRLRDGGWSIVAPELRATGRLAVPNDAIANAPDHNSAEWSLWIGRPLIGQWVYDLRRTLDAIAELDGSLPHDVMAIGTGPAGLVALTTTALDERITRVTAVDSMASYVTDEPYRGQRLGTMIPGVLRDVGDVGDIAALIAPRAVTIDGGTTPTGSPLTAGQLARHYQPARRAFELLDVPNLLLISSRTGE